MTVHDVLGYFLSAPKQEAIKTHHLVAKLLGVVEAPAAPKAAKGKSHKSQRTAAQRSADAKKAWAARRAAVETPSVPANPEAVATTTPATDDDYRPSQTPAAKASRKKAAAVASAPVEATEVALPLEA